MTLPSVKMSEVESLASQIVASPDYDLDTYGLDISAVIDNAKIEQMPSYYNEADESNFELELRSQLETLYDEFVKS